MENASKALLMAGGILIAILIIGAVTFMFRDITEVQKTKEESKKQAQINEYNKQFAGYERTLYGHELLSLINKVMNTNQKNAEQNKYINTSSGDGYDLITIKVDSSNYKLNVAPKKQEELPKETYKKFLNIKTKITGYGIAEKDFKRVADTYQKWQEAKDNDDTNREIQIKREYDNLVEELKISSIIETTDFKNTVIDYEEYADFKTKRFNYEATGFSEKNGRINSITFKEK